MNEEALYAIALTQMPGINLVGLHELYRRADSAEVIMENRKDIRAIFPDASQHLADALVNADDYLKRAEAELQWDEKNKIEVLTMSDDHYPQRLVDCPDAPVVIYYKGNASLNPQHVVSVIGTRHCTHYGEDIIHNFIGDLKRECPDVLVMSGLAYGVDVCAHRESLQHGLPTVGVLAHGLDQIYPRVHRDTAVRMLQNGGLLTEYLSGTAIAKGNFVQRNRIVAGMSDASILIESAAKGGGLITMNIASDYGRGVYAFPGPVNAEFSKGCNNIIRDNGAQLITSADDFLKAMGWGNASSLKDAHEKGIERSLFPDLTDEEQRIVNVLQEQNDLQMNVLNVKTGLAIGRLSALMFSLEMKGVVRMQSGGSCHLIS